MFKRNNNTVIIDTEKMSFEIEPVKASIAFANTIPKLEEFRKKITETPTEETKTEILEELCEMIDGILCCESACAHIFEGQTVGFYDLCDLYFYIKGKINSFNAHKRKEWSGVNESESSD